MLARPDGLEANERDLHGQHQAHYIKSAVGWDKETEKEIKIYLKQRCLPELSNLVSLDGHCDMEKQALVWALKGMVHPK